MTVTAECTLTLPLVDFRRAIAAVQPHAERAKTGDDLTAYQRVRITAATNELWICATNGVTTALAATEILEDSRAERFAADDGVFSVDISPTLIGDLRAGLRMQRGDALEDDQTCEIHLTDHTVRVQDVSGLWPGSATERPTLPFAADYPDLVGALGRALRDSLQEVKPLAAPMGVLARFAPAAAAYKESLQIEPTGPAGSRGFVVWVGDRFIGSVSSGHDDDDSLARRQAKRRAHLERLGLQPALVSL